MAISILTSLTDSPRSGCFNEWPIAHPLIFTLKLSCLLAFIKLGVSLLSSRLCYKIAIILRQPNYYRVAKVISSIILVPVSSHPNSSSTIMLYQFLFLWLLASCAAAQISFEVGRTVKTTSGRITGHASSLYDGVSEYLGVPFAQPPVRDLRFAPPAPIKDASTSINATRLPYSCIEGASRNSRTNSKAPQNLGQAENEMQEDCLYLNIWTKPQTGDKKKAVM